MTFRDLCRLCMRRIGVIVATVACALLGTGAYLWYAPAQYRATATGYVAVSVTGFDGASAGTFYSASQLANQKAQAFASVVGSAAVAQKVVETLDLPIDAAELAAHIAATPVPDSATLRVSAVGASAEEARTIADTVVEVAAREIRTLEGLDSPVQLKLLSSAELASVAVSPQLGTTLTLGLLSGIGAGLGIAIVLGVIDRRIRVGDDIHQVTKVPIIAQLPHSAAIGRETRGDAHRDFQSEEALRKLRTNLTFASIDKELRVCVVSSPNPAEGKSSVALHLAQVMAAAGEDVVLIDADLRRPTVDQALGVDGTLGLSQVLAGSVTLDRALRATEQPGLFVLPAGQIPPNPSELLGSKKMAELIGTLSTELFVILDAPPLLPVTDAALLSRIASGVLLVVRSGKTTSDELDAALGNIESAGGKTVGIVLNGLPASQGARLGYGNTGYYGSHYESSLAQQGSEADFDIRALRDTSSSIAEQVKTFDAVLEGRTSSRRMNPSFHPVRGHMER